MMVVQIIGAVFLLVAFLGLNRKWTMLDDRYIVLNILGGGMLATVAWIEHQWGFAVLNTIWCLAAVRSFGSMRRRAKG